MAERELGVGPDRVHSDAFLDDLDALSNNDLRKAYPREASSHRNRKASAKANGWDFDPAWDEFRSFLRDMGPVPADGYTLDRIDPSILRYGPGLCRWADKSEQTRNRRNTRYVAYDGEEITLAEFADRVGKPYKTVHSALARGVSPDKLAAEATEVRSGKYCPLRYRNDPDGLSHWYQRYHLWKRKVRRDYSAYVCAEVFDIVVVGKLYPIAEAWLRDHGYFELTPFEGALAERLVQSDMGRVYAHGVEWIDHALAQIANRDVKLAAALRNVPDRYRHYAHLHDELVRVPNDDV